MKYVASPICFKPHILLDKNINFLRYMCHPQSSSDVAYIGLWILYTTLCENSTVRVNWTHWPFHLTKCRWWDADWSLCRCLHASLDSRLRVCSSFCASISPNLSAWQITFIWISRHDDGIKMKKKTNVIYFVENFLSYNISKSGSKTITGKRDNLNWTKTKTTFRCQYYDDFNVSLCRGQGGMASYLRLMLFSSML